MGEVNPRKKGAGIALNCKGNIVEAPTGIEPVMRALQAPALPLGYGAEFLLWRAFRTPVNRAGANRELSARCPRPQ